MERDLFVSAFLVRKLLEAPGKVSNEVRARTIPVLEYRRTARDEPLWWKREELDWWTAGDFERFCDLKSPKPTTVSLWEYCNQLIHSLVFCITQHVPEGVQASGWAGIFVASGRRSTSSILYIEAGEILEMLGDVIADDVVSVSHYLDSSGRRVIRWASNTNHPDDPEERRRMGLVDARDMIPGVNYGKFTSEP